MATINYVTLEFPEQLATYTSLIQSTPHFNVYRYGVAKGVIFRIPHGVKPGDVCHFFIEHEINMTNTLRTGTLTMKAQVTVIPCHMGVFSGFEVLKGDYETEWFDEEDYSSGLDRFIPDYNSDENVKKIVPIPANIKTNLYEYLNEILFNKQDDLDIISKYAVSLGCKKDALKKNVKFIPAPENTGTAKNAKVKHMYTQHFFEVAQQNDINLIPVTKQLSLGL